ncbi:hypothetical protein [Bosea minatitlanensis]|uniref:Uncharacterized protein n=1 Tax=Bosea minatitlanensis TaxID=128782 RepID=A0ABW0F581_9HYPH|nr:hypothetical protein [Bosea minatitlanensis]MCT4494367.1 hypothetical protein [Bosea minatitlanensis]
MAKLDGQTPEQARWQAENEARRARQHRSLVDGLEIWSFCPRKGCRRRKSCRHDRPALCLNAFFATMPEELKQYLQLVITARTGGASPAEAGRVARERMIAVDGRAPFDDV